MKIVVLSFKIGPAARPPVRPPSARRPPVRPSARPSVRPPGPGPAEPIYIKLPIDRHGRVLLVSIHMDPFEINVHNLFEILSVNKSEMFPQ